MGTIALFTLLAAAISATVSAASIGINAWQQSKANKANQQIAEENIALQRETREDQQTFAAEQAKIANQETVNQYYKLYSPAAQRAQLASAGMSPGLLYGGGGSIGQGHTATMASTPSASTPGNSPYINPYIMPTTTDTLMDELQKAFETANEGRMGKQIEAQTKNIEQITKLNEKLTEQATAQIENIKEQTSLFESQKKINIVTEREEKIKENLLNLEVTYQQATWQDRAGIVKQTLENLKKDYEETEARINGLNWDNAHKDEYLNLYRRLVTAQVNNYFADTLLKQAQENSYKYTNALTEENTLLTKGQREQLNTINQKLQKEIQNLQKEIELKQQQIELGQVDVDLKWFDKIFGYYERIKKLQYEGMQALGSLAGAAAKAK